jgi:hypothetical protein
MLVFGLCLLQPERKQLGDTRRCIAFLEERLRLGALSAGTIGRLQELSAGMCILLYILQQLFWRPADECACGYSLRGV